MDDKVLGGQGSEKHIQVSSCQPQGLGAGFGELDVIAGRDRAPYTIHCALQSLVLEREMGVGVTRTDPGSPRRSTTIVILEW